jgi:hypothetical protein
VASEGVCVAIVAPEDAEAMLAAARSTLQSTGIAV